MKYNTKSKKKLIGGFVLLVLILFMIFIGYYKTKPHKMTEKEMEEMFVDSKEYEEQEKDDNSSYETNGDDTKKENTNKKQNKIIVEIKGEVIKPNVYTLKEGSRIFDIIEKAGGTTEEANLEGVNRAALLVDGQCIVIKNINDKGVENKDSNKSQGDNNLDNQNKKVNINTASLEELMTVSGIGKTKAAAIISYREKSGVFKKVEDLKNVDGIGEKTVEKLKDKICVS